MCFATNVPLKKTMKGVKTEMRKQKRILAFLIAFSIFSSTFFGMFSTVMAAVSYGYVAEANLNNYSVGDELSQGSYYLSGNKTFDGSSTGNGLKIAEGATVVIYLNGYTLTAIGKNAENGENGVNLYGGDDYGKGGYAGILLPSTSKLIFVGEGIVNATGGNAGKGGAGGNGSSGNITEDPDKLHTGTGGGGGQGGGGAAAGIGTNGGKGGNGGNGGSGFSIGADLDSCDKLPNGGTNGSNSASTNGAGELLVYGNNGNSGSITMNLTGGTAPTSKSDGGSVGTSYYDKGTDWSNSYTATAGAGGGAGGNGYAASGYGTGAVGGAGGAGGASGSSYSWSGSHDWHFRFGKGGTGGSGSMNGGNGTGTLTSDYWGKVRGTPDNDGEPSSNNASMVGQQATGGSVGTKGESAGYTTYYFNGLYARINALDAEDNIVTYKCDDYISKADVEVYALYSTSSTNSLSNTIGRVELVQNSTDGFTDSIAIDEDETDEYRAYRVDDDYWSFVVASNEAGHEGDHQITNTEIKSFTATDVNTVKTGKINIAFNSNIFANCTGFVRDIRVAMDDQQTINKEDGLDATEQDELGDYTTLGDSAMYNEENAVKTITYDNEEHSIAELIAGTGYGKHNGADSQTDITDDFFKNGLNTSDNDAYWYAGYAQDPYYQVVYRPFNSFTDFNATNYDDVNGDVDKDVEDLYYADLNYLTGSDESVILEGTRYSDTANTENYEYVLNGETDQYFAEGQIDKGLIKNAGIYTVTVVVPYKYFTYTYTDGDWFGDSVSDTDYSYFFHTYTFNIVVREADLNIAEATDTVHENTKVQDHSFDRYVEGENGEQVYGRFLYASAFGDEWGNDEDRVVNSNHLTYTDIEWEFNIYEDKYIDSKKDTIDGRKNLNNYLCQKDGESAAAQALTSDDVQNTYYKGSNGVLLFTDSDIATRDADMEVIVNYEKDQKDVSLDNEKTPILDLYSESITPDDTDVLINSVYAEDVVISASITSESLGWRVVKGDAVTGTSLSGTKIESAEDLAEGYQTEEYFDKLIEDGKYKGDLYVVTVKAGDKVVKTFEYTDETAQNTVNNIPSTLAEQITDELPACEYYGVEAYDVKVEYVGLYYTAETNTDGRKADWNGEEEFNWVISEVNFKLDVDKRDVAIKDTMDIDKIYDATTYLVRQTLTDGDVTAADKYIVNLAQANYCTTQFEKKPSMLLYNYIDPTDELTNTLSVEFAGEYDDKNKGEEKEVVVTDARLLDGTTIPEDGDEVDALNYNLVDGNGEEDGVANVTGSIDVARMHFEHILSGTIITRDNTPLHEVFGLSLKSYLLTVKLEKDAEFIDTATMNYVELVEKDDAKSDTNDSFTTNDEDYDYDAIYHINDGDYKQYILGSNLEIDLGTGRIVEASTVTKGGTNPSNFPAMDVTLIEYPNFTVVVDTDEVEVDTYNECEISEKVNTKTESDEFVGHTIRFRIIGNNNSYDVILPINQLNVRGEEHNSAYLNRTAKNIYAGEDEVYNFIALYPNDDSAEFEFTIPQDSYLVDVAVVALEDYKVYDEESVMSTYDELLASIKDETANVIGTYETQAAEEGMNTIENALFMTLDEVNAAEFDGTQLEAPNDQVGGSRFKLTLTTGECSLGENYAIAIVPITAEYDQNLLDEEYESNLSVEQTITSETDATLVEGEDDLVYVNYRTLFDTTEEGTVTLSYEGVDDLVLDLPATNMDEFNSFDIDTEDYAGFFNPGTLIPGTEVTIELEVWRNGVVEGMQREDDNDAFDTVTFTWTVSEDDYNNLFEDDVITVINRDDLEETEDYILGYILSPDEVFNNISVFITNYKTDMETKDNEWSVQTGFDLLGNYIDGIYNIDGTKMTIDETTYQVEGLALGMTIYPYKTCTITFEANGGTGDMEQVEVRVGKYVLPENGFTAPSGKTFDKWNLGKPGAKVEILEDTVITAQWKLKNVIISGGGGSATTTYKITTNAPENGTISPVNPSVEKGSNKKFTFKASSGYEIEEVIIDGVSVGKVSTYILENVKAKHTIELKVKVAETEVEEVWENASNWAKEELNEAREKGLIPDSFAKLDFTKPITRKEFAAVAVKLYEAITGVQAEASTTNPFTDTDDEYVLKAYALGITNGTSETTFTPDAEITREQMATMIARALDKAEISVSVDLDSVAKFDDDSELHEWGRNAVYFMAENGIIKGIGENVFGGLRNATVEQALVISLRCVNVFSK